MTLAKEVEQQLRGRHVPGLPKEFVLPHYGGYSIANVAPTVARVLGVELDGAAPPLPEDVWAGHADGVRCVLLLVLDATGFVQLSQCLVEEQSIFARAADAGFLQPITSVFPSTTVSALTTLWTGRTPLEHGFLGTRLLLPELGVLANMLKSAPAAYGRGGRLEDWGWAPEQFVTVATLGEQLAAAGIGTVAHTQRAFIGSSLIRIFLRGMGEVQGYLGLSDL